VLYAVLGDIHGNLHALEAVLEDLREAGAERVLCVGDIVGYGANPRECVAAVRGLDAEVVAGNHDWAVLDKIGIECFNADARDSVLWTRRRLQEEDFAYLDSIRLVSVLDGITLVHSSLFSPEYFDYMFTLFDVQLAFNHQQTPICFVGHSHVPAMFTATQPINCFLAPEFELEQNQKAIVNVGSVGQPRDLDPRACYVLYESERRLVRMRRVEYDVQAAADQIEAAGLPATNAARILLGR